MPISLLTHPEVSYEYRLSPLSAINRIPDDRIEDAAKCGRCGHDLFDGEVIDVLLVKHSTNC
ncbi:hypothetical protein ACVXG9_25150 [Escherichia coli]